MISVNKPILYSICISFIVGFLTSVMIYSFQTNKNDQKINILEKQNKELLTDIYNKNIQVNTDKKEIEKLKIVNDAGEKKLSSTLSELHNLKNTVIVEKSKTQEELIAKVKTLYDSVDISAIDISTLRVSEELMNNIVFDAENWKVNGEIILTRYKKCEQALNESLDVNMVKDKIISKQDEVIKLRDDQLSKYVIITNNKDEEIKVLNKNLKTEKVNGNIKLVSGALGGGAIVWLITLL